MAKEAIGLYPTSQYAPYFKDQITQARGGLFQQAITENKSADAFRIGGEVLAEDPNNLNYLLTLADYSGRLAKGPSKDFSFSDKGSEYAKKAIELINSGKQPLGVEPAKWEQSKGTTVAAMFQNIGFFSLKANKGEDALVAFNESLKSYCADPITHYLVAQVHKNKYEALSQQYNSMTDDQKTSDEGKAVLEKINPVIDQIVEAYGKMMAFSEGKGLDALRNGVKPDFEGFYKYRHDGKADGMEEYVAGLKAGCTQK